MDVLARSALMVLFVASALSKVMPRTEFALFAESLGRYGARAVAGRYTLAGGVIAAELAVVAAAAAAPFYGEVLGIGLLLTFTASLVVMSRRGEVSCNCFGSRSGAPTVEHAVLNLVVAGICLGGALAWWPAETPAIAAVQALLGCAVGALPFVGSLTARWLEGP